MAGFFGLFNYEKEGPGISKNAPKKNTFVIFFETFFRNFWKFITINLVYSAISIPIVTNGLASAGITHVARNTARDRHSFGLADFFETIKKNWKQALGAGIINSLVYIILAFDIYFFFSLKEGLMAALGLGISFAILFMFTIMQYYIWTLMITFKFTIKQIYKNSFNFVFLNLWKNLICLVSIIFVYAINVLLIFLLSNYWLLVFTVEIFVYTLIFPSFKFLLVQYCTFPAIKKYIIDPYYEAHPNEDIEKRRDLGLDVEEEKPQIAEDEIDGEQDESDNVFED